MEQIIANTEGLPSMPVPAAIGQGAVVTGNYRNLFKEWGKGVEEIEAKVNAAWNQLFYGSNEERIYYPVGNDMAYIYTMDTDDVRSEGMSYGMMACVQMDKKKEFDRLWKWTKTYMQHKSGQYEGFFAWECGTDGKIIDGTPASDGEEYIVTALLFASNRWGDGDGMFDYGKEAKDILFRMLNQKELTGGENMFHLQYKMPVFCPIGEAATFTNPSYHLPVFYEIWAKAADKGREFWIEATKVSREYFQKVIHPITGLMPDYSNFNGTPRKDGNHGNFLCDAWRVSMNIAIDYAWWAKDPWQIEYLDRYQAFFASKGVKTYKSRLTLEGEELSEYHSTGLVACNAVASLAASKEVAWEFVEDLWNCGIPTGMYRYYDGCLYLLGLLHCSGRFKAWL